MFKKYLTLGLLALAGSAHAGDYPEVNLVGVNPDTGAFATVETLITDGAGAIQVGLKIFSADSGMPMYEASTSDMWDESKQSSYKVVLENAAKELLKNSAKKLKQYGVDLTQNAEVLYAHNRLGPDNRVNYDVESNVAVGAEKNFLFSVKEFTPETGSKYWQLLYSNTQKPSVKAEEYFLVASKETEDYPAPNVGIQKVYLIKAKARTKMLVLTSYQNQGFEGPNVNFVHTVIDFY